MQIAIIRFSNATSEDEIALAVKRAGMEPVEFLWSESAEKLSLFKGYIIVGGLSSEDRLSAGVIASQDPIVRALKIENKKGKPILGICWGAQILVESGLVPGLTNDQLGIALADNMRVQNGNIIGSGYYNGLVNMRLSDHYQLNAFTRKLSPKNILQVPVAHSEGRFIIPPVLLQEMQNNGQTVFQYCDEQGQIIDEFPVNPNGSINNIAAVSNKAGNVMAMMPHPEQTLQGDAIFESMCDYIARGHVSVVAPLFYQPRFAEVVQYPEPNNVYELIVELREADKQASSVEDALKSQGISVRITRRTRWEIECDSQETLEEIKRSGILYNPHQEKLVTASELKKLPGTALLVQAKRDMFGREKCHMLNDLLAGIHNVRHGTLWQIDGISKTQLTHIVHSHVLYNPYAYDCYYY